MIGEMQQAGNQGLGDMGGIAKEMDEVIKEFTNATIHKRAF